MEPMTSADPPLVAVSVVIAARNEARHIADCVRSVTWADEILVVENDSTDATVAVAQEAGATAFSHPFVSIGAQRNAAIARARNGWIFVVDADERATPEVGHEIARTIARPDALDAYRVRRRNHFLGHEIRHGGWERDRPVRLFRRGLRYDERPVHEHVIVDRARTGVLHAPLVHYTYETLAEYFEKLDRYSRSWAAQQHARGRRAAVWQVVLKPPARFVAMYVLRAGFLDGGAGAVVAVLAAMSVAAKYARLWELSRGTRPRAS
jgi:glycosyltransferase involved in cell wall biosynthesis